MDLYRILILVCQGPAAIIADQLDTCNFGYAYSNVGKAYSLTRLLIYLYASKINRIRTMCQDWLCNALLDTYIIQYPIDILIIVGDQLKFPPNCLSDISTQGVSLTSEAISFINWWIWHRAGKITIYQCIVKSVCRYIQITWARICSCCVEVCIRHLQPGYYRIIACYVNSWCCYMNRSTCWSWHFTITQEQAYWSIWCTTPILGIARINR